MKTLTTTLGIAALLLAGLAFAPAQPAEAFVYCSQCYGQPPSEECYGACNGSRYYGTCGDYNANCGYLTAPDEESKEAFLASLRERASSTDLKEEAGS